MPKWSERDICGYRDLNAETKSTPSSFALASGDPIHIAGCHSSLITVMVFDSIIINHLSIHQISPVWCLSISRLWWPMRQHKRRYGPWLLGSRVYWWINPDKSLPPNSFYCFVLFFLVSSLIAHLNGVQIWRCFMQCCQPTFEKTTSDFNFNCTNHHSNQILNVQHM